MIPRDTNTSTCRSLATISSALGFFLASLCILQRLKRPGAGKATFQPEDRFIEDDEVGAGSSPQKPSDLAASVESGDGATRQLVMYPSLRTWRYTEQAMARCRFLPI